MMATTELGKYRLDLITEANKEMGLSDEQRKSHHKLFCVSTAIRFRSIIGDMLMNPKYTTDYADALKAFCYLYVKFRDVENK